MKRTALLIIAIASALTTVRAVAAESPSRRTPLVIAFPMLVGDPPVPTDSEAVAATVECMRNEGKVDVLVFNRELPAVVRAVMERRLDQQTLEQAGKPEKALQIAGALGGNYMLAIKGSMVGSEANVDLEMVDVTGGKRWTSSSKSSLPADDPNPALSRSNTISNAASSAVSQLVIEAFGQDILYQQPPAITPSEPPGQTPTEPVVTEPAEPTAPTAPAEPVEVRDTVAEYNQIMRQVDTYVTRGDLPNAIVEIRKAINLEPGTASVRVRLAQMYVDAGMAAEAMDECKRALMFVPDNLELRLMLMKLYAAKGMVAEAAEQSKEIVRLDPKNPDAYLAMGDLYWNEGKPDDAANAYEEAAKLAPESSLPHDRLRRLLTARKMYGPALEHMLQARLLSSGDGTENQDRYQITAEIMRDEFSTVLGRLDAARDDLTRNRMGREDYYKECKDATSRIEALASFLSTQTAPASFKEAHSHGVLAVSLLAQAGGYLVSYLETEKQYYQDQAVLLQDEAKTELSLFSGAVAKT